MGCGGRWYTAWRILACIPVLMIPFALALRAQQSLPADTAPEPSRRTTVLFYVGMVSPGSTQGEDLLELTKVEEEEEGGTSGLCRYW